MITTEFEEELESLKDAELFRYAVRYLREAYQELDHPDGDEEAQEYLDYIYMECSRRSKEWIFDKAQEACAKGTDNYCPISLRGESEVVA